MSIVMWHGTVNGETKGKVQIVNGETKGPLYNYSIYVGKLVKKKKT